MLVPWPILRFLARYSEGLRLSVEHGPVSGVLSEYAIRNEPHGTGPVGRWIDRIFLRARIWDGVRQRTATTKAIIAEILAARRAAAASTMILDVAAGTALYLRELARECGGDDLVIACHDRNPREVMLGRQLVAAEGLQRFTFSVGDATDESSYLTSRDPDVVLAVGLFAIMHSDADVRTVMRVAFRHLSGDGFFVCTTLVKPPVGRRLADVDACTGRPAERSPETIAAWLRESGFRNIDQRFSQSQGFALIGQKPAAGA
jgi:ubiquinone/menaquinone biosynthesis C-methylase UbiE